MTVTRAGTTEEVDIGSKVSGLAVQRGDVLRLRTSGCGGYGDPAERGAEAMEADRLDGYSGGGD